MPEHDDGVQQWFGRLDASVAAARLRQAKLEVVAGRIRVCRLCGLWRNRQNAVPGEGGAGALLMIIGEGPGASEDAAGRPFAGLAGGRLDELLASAGIDRSRAFITNIVKCRAAVMEADGRLRNRAPRAGEVRACHAYLERQIALVRPRVILCLGAQAGKGLLGSRFSISAGRGRWFAGPGGTAVIATYHPSFIQRGGNRSVSGDRLAGQVHSDLAQISRRLAGKGA